VSIETPLPDRKLDGARQLSPEPQLSSAPFRHADSSHCRRAELVSGGLLESPRSQMKVIDRERWIAGRTSSLNIRLNFVQGDIFST